jgi:hypothetical protein
MNPSYKYDKYEFEVGTNKALRNIFYSSGNKGLLSLPCSVLNPGVMYWIPEIFWKLAAKEKVLHPNDDVNKSQSSNDTFSYSHAYCCVKF